MTDGDILFRFGNAILYFDKSEANNVDFFKGENIGYFKINCTSPATVKFSNHYNRAHGRVFVFSYNKTYMAPV